MIEMIFFGAEHSQKGLIIQKVLNQEQDSKVEKDFKGEVNNVSKCNFQVEDIHGDSIVLSKRNETIAANISNFLTKAERG